MFQLRVQVLPAVLLLALARSGSLAPPPGGGRCSTDSDCSLSGACSAGGQCQCDKGWAGARCQHIDVAPFDYPLSGYGQSTSCALAPCDRRAICSLPHVRLTEQPCTHPAPHPKPDLASKPRACPRRDPAQHNGVGRFAH